MKQNIPVVIFLLLVFLSPKLIFGVNFGQAMATEAFAEEEIEAAAPLGPNPLPAPAPRIMYRDVINQLSDSIALLNNELQILKNEIVKTKQEKDVLYEELEEATIVDDGDEKKTPWRKLFGIKVAPGLYDLFVTMFLAILGLVIVAILVLCSKLRLAAKKKQLQYDELFAEFEDYRKASRERFEKQAIDHFNELKKLNKI